MQEKQGALLLSAPLVQLAGGDLQLFFEFLDLLSLLLDALLECCDHGIFGCIESLLPNRNLHLCFGDLLCSQMNDPHLDLFIGVQPGC